MKREYRIPAEEYLAVPRIEKGRRLSPQLIFARSKSRPSEKERKQRERTYQHRDGENRERERTQMRNPSTKERLQERDMRTP
jgi:hypothetical protein